MVIIAVYVLLFVHVIHGQECGRNKRYQCWSWIRFDHHLVVVCALPTCFFPYQYHTFFFRMWACMGFFIALWTKRCFRMPSWKFNKTLDSWFRKKKKKNILIILDGKTSAGLVLCSIVLYGSYHESWFILVTAGQIFRSIQLTETLILWILQWPTSSSTLNGPEIPNNDLGSTKACNVINVPYCIKDSRGGLYPICDFSEFLVVYLPFAFDTI